MVGFKEIFCILQRELDDSAAISMPFPVEVSSRLYDVFFVYFVNKRNATIELPEDCLAVFYDGQRVVNIGDAFGFSSIENKRNELKKIENYRENLIKARELYGEARLEVIEGKRGEALCCYIDLVRQISQPCLLPYYEAMGMEFDK